MRICGDSQAPEDNSAPAGNRARGNILVYNNKITKIGPPSLNQFNDIFLYTVIVIHIKI